MTERESIEVEIRELLRTEERTVTLSNKLFGPDGLFGKLGSNEAERRVVGKSPLFRDAQRRIRELEKRDAAALTDAAAQLQIQLPETNFRVRLEPLESSAQSNLKS